MLYDSLFFAAIGSVSFILTVPCRRGGYKEFWQWWDRVGICIFTFDFVVLLLIAIWRGWFPL